MRGDDDLQEGMFSYISPEKRVPADHPLRPIRKMVDEILKEMSPKFAKLYSDVGRPSIAPERLLRSLLLQIFYSVRSERMLIEQLQYNMLFRWFVGMEIVSQGVRLQELGTRRRSEEQSLRPVANEVFKHHRQGATQIHLAFAAFCFQV